MFGGSNQSTENRRAMPVGNREVHRVKVDDGAEQLVRCSSLPMTI